MNLNKVFILGNLTRDPESKVLTSGQSLASFSVATNRFYVDKSGSKKQEAEFHNITAFGKLAITVSSYLSKGSLVLVEGRLRTRSWQDASGNKRFRTEIIAEKIQLGPRFGAKKAVSEAKVDERRSSSVSPTDRLTEEIPVIEDKNEEINVEDIPF